VEALTLKNGDSYEVACNLKSPNVVGPCEVYSIVSKMAAELGLTITNHYTTGPSHTELVNMLQT